MAVTKRGRGVWWSRFHFLVRFAGLVGVLAAGAGAAWAFRRDLLHRANLHDLDWHRAVLEGSHGHRAQIAFCLLLGGAALAALAFVFELLTLVTTLLGRRGAFGFNATLQAALALALLVGINYLSFGHYLRFDWTRKHQFTLPLALQDQLRDLRGETTIVVYQRHKTFGQLNDKPDAYDYAAERKVVEKVHDAVDQFREFGPQRFKVVVLDVEEEGFNEKVEALAKANPGLREALDKAPENSIFFCADGRVQQIGFKDYFYLDKSDSVKEHNLVLLDQGVEPFARKVLNVDEKRPKVGVMVIHEWLTTLGPDDFGLAGLKKTLTAQGFDVEDVILKKWSESAPPEPAVYSYDESKLDRLEEELAEAEADIRNLQEELKGLREVIGFWKKSTLEELTKQYAKQLGGRKVDEGLRQRQIAFFEQQASLLQAVLTQYTEDHRATLEEKSHLNVDYATEQRRMTDLKAKLGRILADCDLVIIPRMTIRNVILGDRIPSSLHRIDEAQVEALKTYLEAGKPLMACLGPSTEHPDDQMRMMRMGGGGPDDLETMLGQLGIRLNKQTVLFNAETKAFAERRTGLLVSGPVVDIPPVDFDRLSAKANPLGKQEAASLPPNPILAAMEIVADSLGKKLDIKLNYPRPVYYDPPPGEKPAFAPEFMISNAASWNESAPFPTQQRTPRFEPGKADDPAKGTPDEKRRGPFPIGVAVETRVPQAWYGHDPVKPAEVRLVVIGSGSVFVGATLTPAKEELLLDSCNWLLGRDDLLPKAEVVWKFPRVALNPKDQTLWRLTGWFVLPGLFACAGVMVYLVRRVR